jgi:hypothetical protein
MDPCDPKMNISVARAAVMNRLLVPQKLVLNLTHTELCNLLKTCKDKQLPEPPLMTNPRKSGIKIYIKSPITAKETEILLSRKPNTRKLEDIAEKLGVFTNGNNLKERILSKLAADGIPEPIKSRAKSTTTTKPIVNSGNRVNSGNQRVNSGNQGVNSGNQGVNSGNSKFNMSTNRHHITLNQIGRAHV